MSLFRLWYGLIYGALIATVYVFGRANTSDGGIVLFGTVVTIAFLLHLVLWPRLTLQGLKNKNMLFRGLLYGTTQILILKAQANGYTSTAIVGSTMGSVFGVILGRLILKEKIQGIAVASVVLCFIAVFLNPILILQSGFGVLAGLTQGLGFVMARSLMLEKHSIRQSISTGFFVSSVLTLGYLSTYSPLSAFTSIEPLSLLVVLILALVIQYGFFYLYKILDTQRASLLTLSRVPWSIVIEYLFLGAVLTTQQLLSGTLILLGSAFLIFEAKLSSTQTANRK